MARTARKNESSDDGHNNDGSLVLLSNRAGGRSAMKCRDKRR